MRPLKCLSICVWCECRGDAVYTPNENIRVLPAFVSQGSKLSQCDIIESETEKKRERGRERERERGRERERKRERERERGRERERDRGEERERGRERGRERER